MFSTSYASLHLRPAAAADMPAPRAPKSGTTATQGFARVDQATPPTFLDALTVDVDPDGAAGAVVRYQATEAGAYTATARWDDGPAELAWIDQPGANNHAPGVGAAYALHDPLPPGQHTLRITVTHAATGAAATTAATFTVEAIDGLALGVLPANEPSADLAGSVESEEGAVTETPSAPAVAAVYLSSSAWTEPFKTYLAANTPGGHATYGYAVPANDQLNTLPWTNLDTVSVTFTEDVTVTRSDLLVRGVTFAEYPIDADSFAYDDSTFTATWKVDGNPTLADYQPLPADKLLLHVTNFVQDADGNRLDGEWPTQTTAFPSGDTQPDGVFQFRLNVLPGDAYRSGRVNATDVGTVRSREGRSTTSPGDPGTATYNVFADVNGSGVITGGDLGEVRARANATVPEGEPTAPVLPPAAADLVVNASSHHADVSWSDASSNALWFLVQRSTASGGAWADVGTSDDASYADAILQTDTRYFYRVFSANAAGLSTASVQGDDTTAPAAPTDLHAVALYSAPSDRINLTWDAVASAATYNLYRTTPGVPFGPTPHQSGLTTPSFSDTGLSLSTEYQYAVTAVNGDGESILSAVVDTATLPLPPSAFTATMASPTEAVLSWEYPDENVEFIVERNREQIAVLGGDARSLRDPDLDRSRSYQYQLIPRNAGGIAFHTAFVSVPRVLHPPTDLTVEGTFYKAVNLSWTDNSEGEAGFAVEYRQAGAQEWSSPPTTYRLYPAGANARSTTVAVQGPSGSYEFRVRVMSSSNLNMPTGESSNVVAATVFDEASPALPAVLLGSGGPLNESGDSFEIWVERHGSGLWLDVSEPLTVHLWPPAGTAVEGVDFAALPREVTIPAGSSFESFRLQAINDSAFEVGEYAEIRLRAGPNYTVSANWYSYVGTKPERVSIRDDEGIDLDVDSDNNSDATPGGPDGKAPEEAVEDVAGDDTAPGKVILVSDGDADGDGIPDYADGFNLDPNTPRDDLSTGARLVPVTMAINTEAPGFTADSAKLRISYPASDPAAVAASADEPFALPPGGLRLWRFDGNSRRSTASPFGSYLAPGEYPASQFSTGSVVTWYAEAVRPSEATGDIAVTVELDPTGSSGFIHKDTVRLTATKMEIFGRGFDRLEFRGTGRLVAPDLNAPPEFGFTPGPFEVHKIRLHDPRVSGITQLFIDGQGVPLRRSGSFYETSEFVVVEPGSVRTWEVPYQKVVGNEGRWSEVSYSAPPPTGTVAVMAAGAKGPKIPKVPKVRAHKLIKVPAHFDELADAIDQETALLKSDLNHTWKARYPNDSWESAMGKEVHRRIAARAKFNQGRWMSELYVEVDPVTGKTGKVLSIGAPPPEYSIPANKHKIQQVDVIYLKEDAQWFQPGDIWDGSRVETVHDIKNTLVGTLYGDQRKRLLALSDNGKKLVVTTTKDRVKDSVWTTNDPRDARHWVFYSLGLAATGAVALGYHQTVDDFHAYFNQFREVAERSTTKPGSTKPWYEQSAANKAQKLTDMLILHDRMLNFMAHFVIDEDPLDWLRVTLSYKAMKDYLGSVVTQ